MKSIIRISIILGLFIALSQVLPILPDGLFLINTIFTVSGIMFSVGLGLIATFNTTGVKNKNYMIQLRKNINKVRDSFLKYFSISTICYILDYYLQQKKFNVNIITIKNFEFELNWSILCCLLMLDSIIYYIVNFIEIQKLNNDIFDKTNGSNDCVKDKKRQL